MILMKSFKYCNNHQRVSISPLLLRSNISYSAFFHSKSSSLITHVYRRCHKWQLALVKQFYILLSRKLSKIYRMYFSRHTQVLSHFLGFLSTWKICAWNWYHLDLGWLGRMNRKKWLRLFPPKLRETPRGFMFTKKGNLCCNPISKWKNGPAIKNPNCNIPSSCTSVHTSFKGIAN